MKIIKLLFSCFLIGTSCFGAIVLNNQCPAFKDFTIEWLNGKFRVIQKQQVYISFAQSADIDYPATAKFIRVKLSALALSETLSIIDDEKYATFCPTDGTNAKTAIPKISLRLAQ